MQITVKTTFLDGTDRFETGDVRTVDDERAARFIENGWASDAAGNAGDAASGAVDLEVNSANHATGDSNG